MLIGFSNLFSLNSTSIIESSDIVEFIKSENKVVIKVRNSSRSVNN